MWIKFSFVRCVLFSTSTRFYLYVMLLFRCGRMWISESVISVIRVAYYFRPLPHLSTVSMSVSLLRNYTLFLSFLNANKSSSFCYLLLHPSIYAANVTLLLPMWINDVAIRCLLFRSPTRHHVLMFYYYLMVCCFYIYCFAFKLLC